MESTPPNTQPPQTSTITPEDLFSYKYFNAFDLFLFSRTQSNKPQFLLHKPTPSSPYSHFFGKFTKHDPTLFFAVAREFVSYTKGLLHSQNFKYFLAEGAAPINDEEFFLEEDVKGPSRPQMLFSKGVDDICKLLSESPYLYQDSRLTANYFIEIPLLKPEEINQIAQQKGIDFLNVKYFTLEEILDTENTEISDDLRVCLGNSGLLDYINKYIVRAEPFEFEAEYALLSCDPVCITALIPALLYPGLKKHGEKWRFYRAYESDFPTDEELKKIKGIVIPGSGNSAYWDNVEWYAELFKLLDKIVNENKQINLLGICFGAQILAQALGGKVTKMDRAFNRGGDHVVLQPSFYELQYIKELELDPQRPIVIGKAHGDHVVELPTGAILHGSSNVANTELYTIGENVLAMQGHPEFNEAWIAGAHYRSLKQDMDDYETFADEYVKEKFGMAITQEELLKICYKFLKK